MVRLDGVNALPVSGFVEDVTEPQFATYNQFNRESVQLTIGFSEPIDVTTVNFSLITLQSTQSGMGGVSLRLSPGQAELMDSDPRFVVITLSLDDQFAIKNMAIGMLAVNADTSYLIFERGAFSDTAGNVANGISTAVMPIIFIDDTFGPRLSGFELNMEDGILLLTYDDIVRPRTYQSSGIRFQNAPSLPSQSYQLTGGNSVSTQMLGFVINTTITPEDLLQLKYRIGLATSTEDTFIAANTAVTESASGSAVVATVFPAIQATGFVRDQTPPSVTAFSLNLTTEVLSVVANEPLDPASFDASGVVLQNSPNSTGLDIMSVRLSSGVARQTTNSIFQLDIQLSNLDLNQLKQMIDLATSVSNVYLSLDSTAFADFGGNGVEPISGMEALDASLFGGDLIAPTVSGFTLDLNRGQFIVSFSEVVNIVGFDSSSISLQSSRTSASDAFAFSALTQLPSLDAVSGLSSTVLFEIAQGDLNALKRHSLLGSTGTTFATINSDITTDSNNHLLVGVSSSDAVPVTIIEDTSAPVIERLVIDLDEGVFNLTFDEPVDVATVDFTALALVCPPNSFYNVTVATISQSSDLMLEVQLPLEQLDMLLEFVFGRRCDILFYTSAFVSDIFGNPINAITLAEAIIADEFIPDATSPTLVGFDLDMDQGTLNLTFSEAVIAETFNPTGITIQNAQRAMFSYTLTENTTASATGLRTLFVQLSGEDVSGIKAAQSTATSRANTFVTITNVTILDPFNNPAATIPDGSALQVNQFMEDTINPELISFTFGAVNGRVSLSLTFTEVITASSVRVPQLLLMSEPTSPAAVEYTLTSSTVPPINSDIITIPLSDNSPLSDLFFILNSRSPLGQSMNTTYLSFPSSAAADAQGLAVLAVPSSNSVQAAEEPGDLIPPELTNFNLNLDTRTMILEFSEEVATDSFDFTRLTLYSGQLPGAVSYTLTGGTAALINGSTYLIMLADDDTNALQATAGLATSRDDTYLSIERGLASDRGRLHVLPILQADAIQAFNYTGDTRPPELIGFELSLSGSDPLILTFSETIIVSPGMFDISRFTLLGSRSASAPRFVFSSSSTLLTTTNGPVVEVRLEIQTRLCFSRYLALQQQLMTPLCLLKLEQLLMLMETVW